MNVARVIAALVLGALVGELAIGPAVTALAPVAAEPARLAVVLVPAMVGLLATLVALLVLPARSGR